MATEIRGLCVGLLTASADNRTNQLRFVKSSGNLTGTVCAAATDKPIGVLQNKPNTGEVMDILVTGVTKMILGGTVAAGDDLTSDASGRAITAVANAGANRIMGVALQGGTVGLVVEVLLPGVARAL
jgi:hypothetical protein